MTKLHEGKPRERECNAWSLVADGWPGNDAVMATLCNKSINNKAMES